MKEALKVFGITASIISSVGSLVTFNDYSRALFMEKVFGIKEPEKLTEVEVEKLKHQAEKAELTTKVAQLEAEQLKIKQEKAEVENKLLKEKEESDELKKQSIQNEELQIKNLQSSTPSIGNFKDEVPHGWLGVQTQDVTHELAESFNIKKQQGALVAKVIPASPAEFSGIQVGDIITEFNGQLVNNSTDLPLMVKAAQIGSDGILKLLRQGKEYSSHFNVGAFPVKTDVSAQNIVKNDFSEIEKLKEEANQAKLETEQLKIKLEKEKSAKLETEIVQAKKEKSITKEVINNPNAQVSPQSMVSQLINIASKNGGLNNELEIQELTNTIDSIPKPTKGNANAARKINDKGLLALSNNEDFDSAVRLFSEAQKLDPSDVEILNNLGFAYMKQQNFDMAEKTLVEALTLSPARSSAWSNLGDIFALKDNESKAIACYANTYRFSQNRTNTHQFMKKANFEEDVPFLEEVRGKAIVWAKNAYQLN